MNFWHCASGSGSFAHYLITAHHTYVSPSFACRFITARIDVDSPTAAQAILTPRPDDQMLQYYLFPTISIVDQFPGHGPEE